MPVAAQDQFVDILTRVCSRFVQRVTTLYDELLNLEFLLESDECAEYRIRGRDLTESLFSDLYLVFGSTVLDEPLAEVVASLFDSALRFEDLMNQAIEQMCTSGVQAAQTLSVQGYVDSELRDEIGQAVEAVEDRAGDLIQLGATFVSNVGEYFGRAKDEPLN